MRRLLVGLMTLTMGCRGPCAAPIAKLEALEQLPGGQTTNTLLLGSNAFLLPAQNLSDEHELAFHSGNGFFNQGWVEAPASTTARDGLGPLFNARTCSGCHFKDGRGAPPDDGQAPFVGLLLRLSMNIPGYPPHPIYGRQLQDQANPNVPIEAVPQVTWTETPGVFPDGTPFSLSTPTYTVNSSNHGNIGGSVLMSPRVAPHMIGLGLLEAIPIGTLKNLADPDDHDGDGISGEIQWHGQTNSDRVGRFGWKADTHSVEQQVAHAFSLDMGLTTKLIDTDDCTAQQRVCRDQPSGGVPEVENDIFDKVVVYSRSIAVPARRNAENETVLRGKYLFNEIGCADCHVASHTTASAAIPELENQLIWPYTDLLLHDMGPRLSDGRPVGNASGQEWKTPPLWGIGLIEDVSGQTRLMHDGRARNTQEAILWHGGESDESRIAYMKLDISDRMAVIEFVEDL